MLKTRENSNLALEAVSSGRRVDFSIENLDRDLSIVPFVRCKKNGRHAATTDLAQDLITASDLVLKPFQ